MQTDMPPSYDDSLFPELDVKFAKFGPRLGAFILDLVITLLILAPITFFNVMQWKSTAIFILSSLFIICYKPFLEYRFGATLGKMAVGIRVVGYQFQNVTLKEELRRVSFYLVPSIIQQIMTFKVYFSDELKSVRTYADYNNYITQSNPSLVWLNIIVFLLLVADIITVLTNEQNRSLHDLYAGTYVIENTRN
jgi:uncharacterized RDD family membrane protein YckC